MPQHTTGTSVSSHPTNEEKDKGEEEKEKEIVDVLESDSEDLFEAFNQPPSPTTLTSDLSQFSQSPSSHAENATTLTDEIGIQKKQRPTLQELLESPPERKAPRKVAQTQLPTPPAWTRLLTSPPAQQTHVDLVDHKRKREDKGKEVLETGRTQSSQEVDF